MELLYTLRCLNTIRANRWTGEVHHRLDNEGVVNKCRYLDRGFRATTSADADLWKAMQTYQEQWGRVTTISWVKAHAEDGEAKTNSHEQQNKKTDDDAENAYAQPDSKAYILGYCSQFSTLWGAEIDGRSVANKMGATVLEYLQTEEYLDYWRRRTGAGA